MSSIVYRYVQRNGNNKRFDNKVEVEAENVSEGLVKAAEYALSKLPTGHWVESVEFWEVSRP